MDNAALQAAAEDWAEPHLFAAPQLERAAVGRTGLVGKVVDRKAVIDAAPLPGLDALTGNRAVGYRNHRCIGLAAADESHVLDARRRDDRKSLGGAPVIEIDRAPVEPIVPGRNEPRLPGLNDV